MIRLKRFKHQYKRIVRLFIAALLVIIAYIALKQNVKDCYYTKEIFSVIYNLSLAVIASVIFFFILNFWEEDIIKEKYEKKMVGYLKQINTTMKEVVYIIIEKADCIASDQGNENSIKDIDILDIEKAFEDNEEISCMQRDLPETKNKALDIMECQNDISDKIDIIMKLYGNFIAKEDIELLTDVQDTSIFKNINMSVRFKMNCNIDRDMLMEHIEVQKRVKDRIKEINKYIGESEKDENREMLKSEGNIHKNKEIKNYEGIEIREIKTKEAYEELRTEINEKLKDCNVDEVEKEIMEIYNRIIEETYEKERNLSIKLPVVLFGLGAVAGMVTSIILTVVLNVINDSLKSLANLTTNIVAVELVGVEVIILVVIVILMWQGMKTADGWIKDNNKAIEFYKIIKSILEDIASSKNETTEESDLNKNNIQNQ